LHAGTKNDYEQHAKAVFKPMHQFQKEKKGTTKQHTIDS
jgi:hypothetical protein